MSTPAYGARIPQYLRRLEAAFDHWLPPATQHPARLHEAMRYAADGGKRLRPLLVYATGEVLGIAPQTLDAPAVAVELIHAYSLVHDDLPAMDNDDLRRGRATVHRAFDEATAILAGDAMQALAFYVLAHHDSALEPGPRLKMLEALTEAAGSRGMAGGQAIDLAAVGQMLSLAEIEAMHIHKTGALIRACVLMACYARSPLPAERLEALDHYGKCLGLAFQIQDDILDEEAGTETLGKTGGKDRAQNKPTFPSVIGMAAARARAAELFDSARQSLDPLGADAAPLRWLADHIQGRER